MENLESYEVLVFQFNILSSMHKNQSVFEKGNNNNILDTFHKLWKVYICINKNNKLVQAFPFFIRADQTSFRTTEKQPTSFPVAAFVSFQSAVVVICMNRLPRQVRSR